MEKIINNINYRLDEDNLTAEVIRRKGFEYEGNIIIPETTVFNDVTYRVTSIGEHAFDCCSSLTTLLVPDSVMSIEKRAFFGCQSLTNINIPASVKSIGTEAFYDCSSLTSIVIPDSVTSIGPTAFLGCKSLTSIVIPDSVTSIGDKAFDGCKSLTNITFQGTIAQWKKIELGDVWNNDIPAKVVHCTDGDVKI